MLPPIPASHTPHARFLYKNILGFMALPVTILLLSTSAMAADISPEGAATLKTVIQSFLDERVKLSAVNGGNMVLDGQLNVEPASGYYAVTLPHIKMRSATGDTTDMGIITMNALPGNSDKEWKMAVALASPIKFTDAAGKTEGELSIGQQKFAGIWNVDLNSYSMLDARYHNITFKNGTQETTITAPETAIQYNLKSNGDATKQLWSGPITFTSRDIKITDTIDHSDFAVKSASMNMTVKDHNPAEVKKFTDQMSAIAEHTQDPARMTNQHALGMYNLITNFISNSSDGFTSNAQLKDVSYSYEDSTTKEKKNMSIGAIAFGLSAMGFMQDSVDTNIRFSYDGLSISPQSTEDADSVPTKANFDIALNKLPFKALIDLGRGSIQASDSKNAQSAHLANQEALLKLPQLLTQAGTNLTINNTEISSPAYRGFVNGVVNANVQAVKSFTADIKGEIKGLDGLLQKLAQLAQNPNNPAAPKIQQTMGTLTVLQMIGQQKPDDPTTRTYHLQVDDKGSVKMNGADLGAVMGGGMGGGISPVQPAPNTQPVTP